MNTTMKQELRKLTEAEWRELKLNLNMAENMRAVMENFHLTPKEICGRMNIVYGGYKDWICGARKFTIKDIAKFDSMRASLLAEKYKTKIELERKAEEANKRIDRRLRNLEQPTSTDE